MNSASSRVVLFRVNLFRYGDLHIGGNVVQYRRHEDEKNFLFCKILNLIYDYIGERPLGTMYVERIFRLFTG